MPAKQRRLDIIRRAQMSRQIEDEKEPKLGDYITQIQNLKDVVAKKLARGVPIDIEYEQLLNTTRIAKRIAKGSKVLYNERDYKTLQDYVHKPLYQINKIIKGSKPGLKRDESKEVYIEGKRNDPQVDEKKLQREQGYQERLLEWRENRKKSRESQSASIGLEKSTYGNELKGMMRPSTGQQLKSREPRLPPGSEQVLVRENTQEPRVQGPLREQTRRTGLAPRTEVREPRRYSQVGGISDLVEPTLSGEPRLLTHVGGADPRDPAVEAGTAAQRSRRYANEARRQAVEADFASETAQFVSDLNEQEDDDDDGYDSDIILNEIRRELTDDLDSFTVREEERKVARADLQTASEQAYSNAELAKFNSTQNSRQSAEQSAQSARYYATQARQQSNQANEAVENEYGARQMQDILDSQRYARNARESARYARAYANQARSEALDAGINQAMNFGTTSNMAGSLGSSTQVIQEPFPQGVGRRAIYDDQVPFPQSEQSEQGEQGVRRSAIYDEQEPLSGHEHEYKHETPSEIRAGSADRLIEQILQDYNQPRASNLGNADKVINSNREQDSFLESIYQQTQSLSGLGPGNIDLFNGNDPNQGDNFEDNENMEGTMSGYERQILNKRDQSSNPQIINMSGPQGSVMGLNNNYPTEVKTSKDREVKDARDYTPSNMFSNAGQVAPSISIGNSIDAQRRRFEGFSLGPDGDYGGASISDDIKHNLSLPSEQGGSNFFADEEGNPKDFEDMMKYVGKNRMTKNYDRKQNKWNIGDQEQRFAKMRYSGPSVSELRKTEIPFKPASRTHKTNYVNLIRLSNQTRGLQDSQYVP